MATKKQQVELIREGCKLDRRIKKAQVKLAAIKLQMQDWESGTVGTEQGDTVTISRINMHTEPNPTKIYKWFKKNLTAAQFFSCVKIQVDITKKLMGEPMFEKLLLLLLLPLLPLLLLLLLHYYYYHC